MARSIVQDILKRNDAVMVVEEVQHVLSEEARRRAEFREWITPEVKAEFILGEVVVHSPAKRYHIAITGRIFRVLSTYVDVHMLGVASAEKAMVGLTRNDYEPDVCYWSNEKSVGFTDETTIHPPPDLAVEVLSKKKQKNDRGIKFEDYALHGVREYWIVDPWRKCIEQYSPLVPEDKSYLLQGKYGLREEVTSIVLPQFSMPVAAAFDDTENLKALRRVLAGQSYKK